jgi:hypothetical protein
VLTKLQISKPSIYFALFLFIAQFINGLKTAQTGGYSSSSYIWFVLAFFWALSWWLNNDSKEYDIKWFDKYMDMGMFLYIGWIFLTPYYLFKTRGWKALYTIGLFIGVYFGALIIGTIVYFVASLV